MPDPRRRVLPAAAVGCSVVGRRSFCPPAVTSAGAERRPEQGRCRERCPHLPRGHRVQPDDTCTERKAAWPLCVSVPTGESRGCPVAFLPQHSPPPASRTPLARTAYPGPFKSWPSLPSWWVSPPLFLWGCLPLPSAGAQTDSQAPLPSSWEASRTSEPTRPPHIEPQSRACAHVHQAIHVRPPPSSRARACACWSRSVWFVGLQRSCFDMQFNVAS